MNKQEVKSGLVPVAEKTIKASIYHLCDMSRPADQDDSYSYSSCSSRFPDTYLHVLKRLPLPERYLVKTAADNDTTWSELSLSTQVDSQRVEAARQGDGDDTDLDVSDFEDEFEESVKINEEDVESKRKPDRVVRRKANVRFARGTDVAKKGTNIRLGRETNVGLQRKSDVAAAGRLSRMLKEETTALCDGTKGRKKKGNVASRKQFLFFFFFNQVLGFCWTGHMHIVELMS